MNQNRSTAWNGKTLAIILGISKLEGTLNKIVLWGKKIIYRSKMKEKPFF